MNIANTGPRQAALSESDAQLNVPDSVPNTQYPVHVLVDRSSDNGSPYVSRLHCILTYPHSWVQTAFAVVQYQISLKKSFDPETGLDFLTNILKIKARGDPKWGNFSCNLRELKT